MRICLMPTAACGSINRERGVSKKVIVFGVDGLMMPLIKKFAAEGKLPHISRMLEQGAATELLPYISAWGDVNWAAFISGQRPGTSWCGQALPGIRLV